MDPVIFKEFEIEGIYPDQLNEEDTWKILAIDGCSLDCFKFCLQQAGFDEFEHIRVTDLEMEKGKSPATEENIAKVTAKANEMLN